MQSNMSTLTWTLQTRKTVNLKPAEYNPRKMTEQERRDLKASIAEFGRPGPLVINTGSRADVLIGGHQRQSLYLEEGIEDTEVLVPSRELTIAEEKRLNLRLNKNTGSWDYEKLKDMGLNVLLDVGFGDEDLQMFFDDVEMFDDAYPDPKPKEVEHPKTKFGDIYQLGAHRVMCGNPANEAHVQKLLGDALADLVWVNTPNKVPTTLLDVIKGADTVINKHATYLNTLIETAKQASKPNSHLFLWTKEEEIWIGQTLLRDHDFKNERVMLWIQSDMKVTRGAAFNKAYQPCLYATQGKPYLNPNLQNLNEVLNKEVNPGNQLQEDIWELLTIWLDKQSIGEKYDPERPVTLLERPIKRCTAPSYAVLDLFANTGSSIIACEQLKRTGYAIEPDPGKVDLIVERWEAFTNHKAKAL